MTMHEEIETRLRRAVAVAPSADGLRSLDERVAQVMTTPAATHRRGVPTLRMFLRPLALVATFVVLAGTVVGAMGILERTVESNPGWRTAWDRAEILGLQQTDAGVTITLERAYADLNQVLAFFTVEGLEAPRSSDGGRTGLVWNAELRGPTGQRLLWSTGRGPIETNLAAIVEAWGPPDPVGGTYELTINCLEVGGVTDEVLCAGPPRGTWRFEFELPKPIGTVVSADARDTAGQATVTLTQLRVSPTMITGRIALRVAGSTVAYWGTTNGVLRHGSTSYDFNAGLHITRDAHDQGPNGDENEFGTLAGSDETTGTWEIEIPELWYVSGDGGPETAIHLAGPWTFTVTVP